MPVIAYVNNIAIESTDSAHAEKNIFKNFGYQVDGGDSLYIEMNAWPCTKGKNDTGNNDCHTFLKRASKNRTITVKCTDDHAGYASGHGDLKEGVITYSKGFVTGDSRADQYAADYAKTVADAKANAANKLANKGKGPKKRR
jgi:hypothetical protein